MVFIFINALIYIVHGRGSRLSFVTPACCESRCECDEMRSRMAMRRWPVRGRRFYTCSGGHTLVPIHLYTPEK